MLDMILFITMFIYLYHYLMLRAGRCRGSNPGEGEIFRTCPKRLWGPPSLLYNVYPGSKAAGAWLWPPHLAPRLKKEYSYTSTPPLGLRGLFWVTLYVGTFILVPLPLHRYQRTHQVESCNLVTKVRSTLFCATMQRTVVISYRGFGTTYRFRLQGSRIFDP